ncbi:MAG: undecaprenyl-diphosphate phosphatase [Lachnospiraceae bacterium]|nr:undecaprenyl-diphosphate phosphatase [Lachnospiraceae bacterium]
MGFLLMAILLLVVALMPVSLRSGRDLTMRRSFLVGILQGAAVLPGISRLGAVYTASQLLGMHRKTAARFAILSVLPITFGALLYEFTIGIEGITMDGSMVAELLAAAVAAGFVGGRMVRAAGRILRKNCVRLFCVINAVLGLICVVAYVIR